MFCLQIDFLIRKFVFSKSVLRINGWVYMQYPKQELLNLVQTLIGYCIYTLLANVFLCG